MLQNIKGALVYLVNQITNIGIFDIVDIVIVTVLFYYLYKFIRDRRASKLAIGIVSILAIMAISYFLKMHALNFIISNVVQVGIVGVIILFHDELRSFLEKVGGESIKSIANKKDSGTSDKIDKDINVIADAVFKLSKEKTGALIVLERGTKLGDIIASGTVVNADINSDLIRNIFFNKSPLHDGAMVLRDGRIHAAGCFLPLSQSKTILKSLGTRHRAAVGMSENSDAAVIVVSEESGTVSVAFDGKLTRGFSENGLISKLKTLVLGDADNKTGEKIEKKRKKLLSIFKDGFKNKKQQTDKDMKKPGSPWVKVICLIAAFVVWFYAAGEQSPATNKKFSDIPVKIEGIAELEQQGYSIISGSNATADVTLVGKRGILNNLDVGDVTIAADLSGIYSSGKYQINLKAVAPNGTTLSKVNPETISIVIDRSSQKQVNVEPVIVSGGVNDPNLQIEALTPSYPTIRVTGPEKELEKVSKAVVDVSLSGLIDKTTDYTGRVYLVDSTGKKYESELVTCDKNEIKVNVLIRKYKTVPIEVAYADKNVDGYAYKIELETNQIEISGNADIVDSIDSIKTENVVLSEITHATNIRAKLILPPGVYTNESDFVTISITPQNGTEKKILTSNICVINVEEGVEATVAGDEVEFKFVGSPVGLSGLNSKNVYAIADISGYTTRGTYDVKLNVVYPDNLDVKLSKDAYCKINIKKEK